MILTADMQEPIHLGLVTLEPEALREDTEALFFRIDKFINQLDGQTSASSANHRLLVKTGLVSIAKQLREELKQMKRNSVVIVARKAFAHLELVRGRKMKVLVRILDQSYTVDLRHDHTPWKNVDETIAGYHSKAVRIRDQVDKLMNVLSIAAHFEDDIRWNVYERLLLESPQHQLSLDFFREAFIYGVRLRRVFKPEHPKDPVYMRIYRKAFWNVDRQLAVLSTYSHEVKLRIPFEWDRWVRPYADQGECLFKTSDEEQTQRRRDARLQQRLGADESDPQEDSGPSRLILL